jgi:YegS/Rv2252/BmrU family lipid kinase
MPNDTTDQRSTRRALKEARAKHTKLLDKVLRSQTKLEQRRRKLEALETTMLQLEGAFARATASAPGHNLPPHARTVRLIYNAKAGRSGAATRLEEIVALLRAHGLRPELELKTSAHAARVLAREAIDKRPELVIVAGGDSSIEEVARVLVGTETTLGILPIGTMNNLARVLGVPLDLDQACALLAAGTTRAIDVGRLTAPEQPHGSYFIETAGIGLSALIAPGGQELHKRQWIKMLALLGPLFTFQPAHLTIAYDDLPPISATTQVVTISNSPLIGAQIPIAAAAKLDDGALDVVLYDDMSKMALAAHFLSPSPAKPGDLHQLPSQRVRRMRVSCDRPLAASLDVQVLPQSPIWDIEVVPHALRVIAGNGPGLTLPAESIPATLPALESQTHAPVA